MKKTKRTKGKNGKGSGGFIPKEGQIIYKPYPMGYKGNQTSYMKKNNQPFVRKG